MSSHQRLMMSLCTWFVAISAFASSGAGQEPAEADRGPRFLWRASPIAEPVPIDMNATPTLRRRVTLTNADATVGQLLGALQKQTGVKFIYSGDAIPVARRVGLRAESITLAAALTE